MHTGHTLCSKIRVMQVADAMDMEYMDATLQVNAFGMTAGGHHLRWFLLYPARCDNPSCGKWDLKKGPLQSLSNSKKCDSVEAHMSLS